MPKEQQNSSRTKESSQNKGTFTAPAIQLPKGGGAIRGIGEKFAANPVTGTGSMTVPIATSPGRSGFGPQLSLSYDSGAGNGPFGFGWSLSLPSITRKTDKGLPKYQDAEESDVFILSGAEDLVPVLVKDNNGRWEREIVPPRTVNNKRYKIQRYRPRIEGLFARIEHWTNDADPKDTFWRSISKDNITTWYGKTAESRIADLADPTRIFSWLICESYDDKGNVIVYGYKEENSDNIDLSQAHERNRTVDTRKANRYLKRIRYGNRVPYFPQISETQPWPSPPGATLPDASADWLFEVVFDYDEGRYEELPGNPNDHQFIKARMQPTQPWPVRQDPFSSYRSGFEVRTYRLCHRVLMFHHFKDELGIDDYLVRSTEFTYDESPIASFITSVAQSGYKHQRDETYLRKSLPPLEFEYSKATIQEDVREIDPECLENLPNGLDGVQYQWVDLDGEGISGMLTEQAGGWFYKRNLSPIPVKENGKEIFAAHFAPLEVVAQKPSLARVAAGQQQFLDLAGDGKLDLVQLERPLSGFYERTDDAAWEQFRPFISAPNIDWGDPNLKFVDLTGDGHADILITENEAFTWYRSLAEDGFDSAQKVHQVINEEEGPRLVFADGTQSIYLADISGDGLSDLVRIRNGEVCYWPNLGYGRFGKKVTMDNAPYFDHPELFDQRRIRLADIDGSGTTDIIYLAPKRVNVYRNQTGNSWASPESLMSFPQVDNLASVMATDLLGNGTACLVWSSPLPGNARRPMRYIDLMGGQKPHLLIKSVNNLGAETKVHYAASTKFYLTDKRDGKPWITRIPFPVHVVERVETYDHISLNRFVTRYAYHHGYFDGEEREFRGFGMVEQWDTEEFAALTASGDLPVGNNIDDASHVPPVLTKTWFHTGAYIDRNHNSNFFAGLIDVNDKGEYYREPGLDDPKARELLLDDTVLPDNLTIEEEREACRALKGSMLRQEVYALDGTDKEKHPYTVTEQNFTVSLLQPISYNRHAVFFTHAREAINYHYERNPADPRIGHTLTLDVDKYGNVLKQAAIGYGRRPGLSPLQGSDKDKQEQPLITYTENDVTNPIDLEIINPRYDPDNYRTPLPSEARTYELTGLSPEGGAQRFSFEELTKNNFEEIRNLSDVPYEQPVDYTAKRKRLIERVSTLYRKNDLTDLLSKDGLEFMALPGESYKLAFTPGLLNQVYQRNGQPLLPDHASVLKVDVTTGQFADRGGYVDLDVDDHWWIPSGRMFYSLNANDNSATERDYARQHFFLPHRYRDPFHTNAASTETFVTFDVYDLLMVWTRDPLGNVVTVATQDDTDNTAIRIDYRVLQPYWVTDSNGNRTRVSFDALGMVVGTAVMGKSRENLGDLLDGFVPDLIQAQIDAFLAEPREPGAAPSESVATQIVHDLLGQASTRIVYDLDRFKRLGKPPFAATIARETHVSDLAAGERSKLQVSFSYSDGFGREIQKKIQAEPGPLIEGGSSVSPRWVGSGWTIFNNKGKPVRQYEPFFDNTHDFKFGNQVGVSPILFYDPVERVVATLHPNHIYEKVVFDPWHQKTYDVNDTVAASGTEAGDPRTDKDIKVYVAEYFKTQPNTWQTWHAQRQGGALGAQEQAAAIKAAAHTNTPTTTYFDTLGRTFHTIAHNRFERNNAIVEEKYPTRVELDIEGNQREVVDAKDRIVMRYDYDMLSNKIKQVSMDAGERWMLNNVAGKPIRTWDSRNHEFSFKYDALQRPTEMWVRGGDGDMPLNNLYEKIIYGENKLLNGNTDSELNLRGKPFEHYDTAGKTRFEEYDFKGNLLKNQRWLTIDYKSVVNWDIANRDSLLENESFITEIVYDALNRVVQNNTPDGSITRPTYNEANLLESVEVEQNGTTNQFVKDINYNEKGQRRDITYGNNIKTTYAYDKETFRLLHLQTKKANGKLLQDLYYTYDPVGNICQIEDKAIPTVYFNNFVIEPINNYTYDAIYRLINAEGKEHIAQVNFGQYDNWNDSPFMKQYSINDPMSWRNYTQQYQYDEVGNITLMDHKANGGDWTRNYDYETTNNRLKSTTVHGHRYPYRHHPQHGFIDFMPHLPLMKWDFKDQLQATSTQIVNNGGTPEITYYVYDSSGQRVRKVTENAAAQNSIPAKKNERIYLGNYEIYREHSGDNAGLERKTLHVMDDKQRIAMIETRNEVNDGTEKHLVRYQFSNHLGTACMETSDSANPKIISYEEYHPYGTTSYQAVNKDIKASAKRYRYTGKERDEESGLYYHGARYYAPWLGRWSSADHYFVKKRL